MRTIESAPRDGTEILVWTKGCGWLVARWVAPSDFLTELQIEEYAGDDIDDSDWFFASYDGGDRIQIDDPPTHWMPMPPDPDTYSGTGRIDAAIPATDTRIEVKTASLHGSRLDPDDLLEVLDVMYRHGGSFVKHLSHAWMSADPVNRGRLMIAFGDYYAKYRDIARQEAWKP